MTYIEAAVEGLLDEAVVKRLATDAGARIVQIHVKGGRAPLLDQLRGYHEAARYSPWLVLCDLDQDECAPAFVGQHLPTPSDLCLRVAVRSVESWLLADPGLASFLGVKQSRLPRRPEMELRPKQSLVNLARSSRRRVIREDVGGEQNHRDPGPRYNDLLIEFVRERWDPRRAAEWAPSLGRAIGAVGRLASA